MYILCIYFDRCLGRFTGKPPLLYVVIAALRLIPVNPPQKIARGGRDLGRAYPP